MKNIELIRLNYDANAYFDNKKYINSAENLKKISEKLINFPAWDYLLTKNYFYLKDYEKCLEYWLKTLKNYKNDVDIIFFIAKSYEYLWQNQLAIKYYINYIELEPYSSHIYDSLIHLLWVLWKSREALYFSNMYLKNINGLRTIGYEELDALFCEKKYEELILEADKILLEQNNRYEILTLKSKALYELEKYDEVIEILKNFLKKFPNDGFVLYNLWWSYIIKENYLNAKKLFEQYMKNDFLNHNIIYSMWYLCLKLKDYNKAIEYFDTILNFNPNHNLALYNKARVFALNKEKIICFELLEKLIINWFFEKKENLEDFLNDENFLNIKNSKEYDDFIILINNLWKK